MEFFQYHNGAICYVNLKNFMGHREFMWQPGPKFNLITGQVESGKTSILQAIRIGLGKLKISDSVGRRTSAPPIILKLSDSAI